MEPIKKTISEAQRKCESEIAMKAHVHRTGQSRDTDTILPNVSWVTPTKKGKGALQAVKHKFQMTFLMFPLTVLCPENKLSMPSSWYVYRN